MTHSNAPLNIGGRRRLIERCRTRPIAHIATEAGVSRGCLSKWKNRYDQYGEAGLRDRSSVPHSSPTQTPPDLVERIERLRRDNIAVMTPQTIARTCLVPLSSENGF
ncbi:helix-turn-helix domain-containing protein [Streptomyces sp. CA2R101]|uniref:helix-turn-helix domain-containing protein n=1 Tax=Streptomyces sp. CA2R101 TaxID=3120152 RepID=UPI003008D449